VSFCIENEGLKFTIIFPFLPLLVVIITTPLAPLEPYIAVADASFNISIDSTSSAGGNVPCGYPSTTYKGSFEALIEEAPLIRIL
jgi:hypothetical protein